MQKADSVVAKAEGSDAQYEPHPEGTFLARCVDVIDLGEAVEQFADKPKKLTRKCALVFVTGEFREFDGQPELHTLTKEFTVSFGEKANLRKFAESWRGKRYKDEELTDGIDIGKMQGQYGQISVEQVKTKKGRLFANIVSVIPVMKGTPLPPKLGAEYERPKYLIDKKAQYAEDAAAFRKEIGAPVSKQPARGFDAPLPEPTDDLPF